LDVGQRLLASMGGTVEIGSDEGSWQAQIVLPSATISILIMDDNPGLINLFRRYLADRRVSLIEAHTAEETIEIAAKNPLQLAIVDVMMPEQDGWEVLQHLRMAPETSNLPIAVCSVLNEPEIAYGLGASAYLPKPVTQDAFLTLVEEWCAFRPQRAAMPSTAPADNPTPRSP
jgi:CheY-like chemotaxis protein